jgi:hypothetical protein
MPIAGIVSLAAGRRGGDEYDRDERGQPHDDGQEQRKVPLVQVRAA